MRQRVKVSGTEAAWSAFEAEAMPHAPGLFRLAMWLERNRTEAEDLVQETLARGWESFHRFEPGSNCRAWLVTILRHVRSNRRRALGRSPVIAVADAEERIAHTIAIAPAIPEHLTDAEVLSALGRLPAAFQDVVVLADVEDLSYKAIAEALEIPLGTVMSRLHRARGLLRVELAAYANARGIGRMEHS